MTQILHILINALPLIFAATGALISEYAGVMAIFTDGIINLSAFLMFTFSAWTGSTAAGCILTLAAAGAFIVLTALYTEKTRANPFITGIAVNLLCNGLISLCSSAWFSTRGVLSKTTVQTPFTAASVSFAGVPALLVSAAVLCALAFMLQYTRWGLRLRITGSSAQVLKARGVRPARYRVAAWALAGLFSAWAGVLCTLRLSSFVPNVSAGRGWIALAAVFAGKRTVSGTLLAAIVFTAAEYVANNLRTGNGTAISPTLLLAIPYLTALIVFALMPGKHTLEKN